MSHMMIFPFSVEVQHLATVERADKGHVPCSYCEDHSEGVTVERYMIFAFLGCRPGGISNAFPVNICAACRQRAGLTVLPKT